MKLHTFYYLRKRTAFRSIDLAMLKILLPSMPWQQRNAASMGVVGEVHAILKAIAIKLQFLVFFHSEGTSKDDCNKNYCKFNIMSYLLLRCLSKSNELLGFLANFLLVE